MFTMKTLAKFIVCLMCLLVVAEIQLTPFQREVKMLLPTQRVFTQFLKDFYNSEAERVQKIRNILRRHMNLRKAAMDDKTGFLDNPLYVYLLLKSLTSDLTVLKDLLSSDTDKVLFNESLELLQMPKESQLYEALHSLSWYQAAKKTDDDDQGYLDAKTLSAVELTDQEFFELGLRAHNIANYDGVIYWMKRAVNFSGEVKDENVKCQSLEYLSYAYKMEGKIAKALDVTSQLLELRPNNTEAKAELDHLMKVLEDGGEVHFVGEKDVTLYIGFEENLRDYNKLCKGQSTRTAEEDSKLVCRLFTNGDPFLLLQPAREEELNLEPRMVFYHNVLSEKEAEQIKSLAAPKLKQSHVDGPLDQQLSQYRISTNAWLGEEDHEVIAKFSRRITAITGLSMELAESYQVANYGVGGFYRLHPDFSADEELEARNETISKGNRIATWLTYLNDVEEGGFTVFPRLGAIVKPERGSAVLWYNLYKNSSCNFDTIHAACPVVSGTKWIANKWIRERDQMFSKPCDLNMLK